MSIISMSPEWPNFWVQLVLIISTTILALFGDWIRGKFFGPRLRAELKNTKGSAENWSDGKKARFFHLCVSNSRTWVPAQKVKLFITSIVRANQHGQGAPHVPTFPVQLVWTPKGLSDPSPTIRSTQTCDLGHLTQGATAFELDVYTKPLSFDTTVAVNSKVRIYVEMEAENCVDTISAAFEIHWDGLWSDDDDDMAKHLVVTQL